MAFLVDAIGMTAFMLLTCIAVEAVSPKTRFYLRRRFPGFAFTLIAPLLSAMLTPIFVGQWKDLGVSPIIDLGKLSSIYQIAVLVLLYDFINYWEHRFEHRFLWRLHAVHHSLTDLHAANSYAHPLQFLSIFVFQIVPMSLLGLNSVKMPLIASALIVFWAMAIHSPIRIHFGPMRRVIVDNRFHRVHHSMEERHFDRNFAPIFSMWDHLFGTAYHPRDDEWPEVGVAGIQEPVSLWTYLLHPFSRQFGR